MESAPPMKRDKPNPPVETSASSLPLDALYEILLRLPAKDLCRLRVVCRSWYSISSDQIFIKDHSACHTGPFITTTFVDDGGDETCGVKIVDLSSGEVIKRIHTKVKDVRVQRTATDLVCLMGGSHPLAISALNPATGAIISSTHIISEEYESLRDRRHICLKSCAFGKVPSTGEYKAFRFLNAGSPIVDVQLCEIITLDGSSHARWRAVPGPQAPVYSRNKFKSVVVGGVAYFLFNFSDPRFKYFKKTIKPGSIAPFNLETEKWMEAIDGPEPVSRFYEDGKKISIHPNSEVIEHLSITNLNDFLVTVHVVRGISMDLWFLMDIEKGLWVQKYSLCFRFKNIYAYPFLVLNDDNIIFMMQSTDVLRSYDPKTSTYTDVMQVDDYRSIGIYTGNLLN